MRHNRRTHIHLLVQDSGDDVIPQSMQLIAGRTAQEYNRRKRRKGAFWEDRYHATAIETGEHLHRCLVYIDLNMVRAGVVRHPSEWAHGGYREIQQPRKRYTVIDLEALSASCGFTDAARFQEAHRQWVEAALRHAARVKGGGPRALPWGARRSSRRCGASSGSAGSFAESSKRKRRIFCGNPAEPTSVLPAAKVTR